MYRGSGLRRVRLVYLRLHPGPAGFVFLPGDLGMISMHDVRFIEPVGRLGPVS